MKLILKNSLSNKFKTNSKFYELHPETQYMLNIVMTLMNSAHLLDVEHNRTGRHLLEIYSPDNKLLSTSTSISWGFALHELITDVILEKDLLSQASKEKYIH